jgi:hypothetical protein
MRIRLAALVLALLALTAGPGAIAAAKGVNLNRVPDLSPNPPVALPAASAQPPTASSTGGAQPLPRTGIDATALLEAGVLMLAAGVALQRTGRRRRL